jgi:DHA2 family multidrug resistance protein
LADPARDNAVSDAPELPPLRVIPAAATSRGEPHKYLIAFAVVLAALMQVIDSSIVNVALPDMMGNLGASLDEIARGWAVVRS